MKKATWKAHKGTKTNTGETRGKCHEELQGWTGENEAKEAANELCELQNTRRDLNTRN